MAAVVSIPAVEARRWFYVGMASVIALVVLWGFAPSYYLHQWFDSTHFPSEWPIRASLPTRIKVHAVIFTAWIALFLVQASLVAAARTDLHRKLGVMGVGLAMLVCGSALHVAVTSAGEGFAPAASVGGPLTFLAISFLGIVTFAGLIAAAVYYRQRGEVHKRLMLLATVSLTWSAITRMAFIAPNPILMFGLLAALLFAAPAHDALRRVRVHPVSLWGAVLMLASFPVNRAIGSTEAWQVFAAWLVSLSE